MKNTLRQAEVCPFYSQCDSVCHASLHMMSISGTAALIKCQKEDHDNCPLFLSKVLRSI
ncbi:MAG: hypothetical protein M0Z75_06555 [Nitrospiraceae bacterium]|nr:hypothetical protein [Nitrospiraceae bacterium]MDA8091058.1 hypothetical protein [Nitrospiraceae bacterium]